MLKFKKSLENVKQILKIMFSLSVGKVWEKLREKWSINSQKSYFSHSAESQFNIIYLASTPALGDTVIWNQELSPKVTCDSFWFKTGSLECILKVAFALYI